MAGPTIRTDYQRRGLDCIFIENESLRVEILAGKGGDITELRDKRTDTNVLFETPHRWRPPDDSVADAPDDSFAFLDHYPGGWQNVVPNTGGPATVAGAPLPQHGPSTLHPWTVEDARATSEEAVVVLSTELTRYPLKLRRKVSIPATASRLTAEDRLTNVGTVPVSYSWLQHIAFGPPLVGPGASVEIACETVEVDPDHDDPNARLQPGARGSWPILTGRDGEQIDLRELPARSERVHDLVALADLNRGAYVVRNPELNLAVSVTFPADLYEYIWYWGAFGGFETAPFFGRNYTLGLEPATSIPNAGLERAIENGTANTLDPDEERSATVTVETSAVAGE